MAHSVDPFGDSSPSPPLKVYWRPGCSSCVRVKEFLASLGVAFESINVSARPEAMDELRKLGARSVPVVTRGNAYVFAQELSEVSTFVGRRIEFDRLAAPVLMEKWVRVLEAHRRNLPQLPEALLSERATEGRDRSVRDLAYHVFQIPDCFLQAILDGNPNLADVYNAPPPPGVKTVHHIVDYGMRMQQRLEHWWRHAQPIGHATVQTYYGEQPLHHLLERCTWHSAQHARQIIAVLERVGIAPTDPLTAKDYEGLPMPAGLWE